MILVTGSAGHLGEALMRLAAERGLPVRGIDRMDARPRNGYVKVRLRDAASTEVTVDLASGRVLHVGPRGDVPQLLAVLRGGQSTAHVHVGRELPDAREVVGAGAVDGQGGCVGGRGHVGQGRERTPLPPATRRLAAGPCRGAVLGSGTP